MAMEPLGRLLQGYPPIQCIIATPSRVIARVGKI